MEEEGARNPRCLPINVFPPTPLGLEALYTQCRSIYPDQVNPLQVTALVKYWLGGPDPLDYISMYTNPGVPERHIPPHWHYISFGLSDLHGDGRVHDPPAAAPGHPSSDPTPSGFGFELSFRLKRETGETAPPTWPAAVMQALAKYVFQSANTLIVGDHVSWHCALDNSESRIQHMLMSEDPQLGAASTPFGQVHFVQIVGVTTEELQAAQHWNGPGVLDILKRLPGAGGPWLITDMRRGESMLELDLAAQEQVERGIEVEGSNLSGVSARCSWTDLNVPGVEQQEEEGEEGCREREEGEQGVRAGRSELPPQISEQDSQQIKNALKKGLLNTKSVLPPIGRSADLDDNDNSFRKDSYDSNSTIEGGLLESTELLRAKKLDGLHLTFNLESGGLLPLAIRGRVKHGRHFTFKSVLGDTAITLVAPVVTGTLVTAEQPYVAHGPWLQVLVPDQLAQKMITSFEVLANPEQLVLPKTFKWPEHRLAITIVEDKL